MTNEELADWGIEHGGMMLREIKEADPRMVSPEVLALAEFAVEAAEAIRRLREQDEERLEEGLANLFYAYEDAKKALASVLAAYDELAFGLDPQEPE